MKIYFRNHTLLKTRLVMYLKAVTYRRILAKTLIAHLRHLDFFKNKHPNRRNMKNVFMDMITIIILISKEGISYLLSLTYDTLEPLDQTTREFEIENGVEMLTLGKIQTRRHSENIRHAQKNISQKLQSTLPFRPYSSVKYNRNNSFS